jgi:beta-glucanase (GH16 family)
VTTICQQSPSRGPAIRSRQFLLATIGLCWYGAAAAQNVLLNDTFQSGPLNAEIWAPSDGVYKDSNVPLGDRVFYSPQAISVDKGLKLVLRQRTAADDQTGVPFRYVSGRIQSRQAYLYGNFEFSARLPAGRGLWPALWLRTPPPAPMDGEIDVIEGHGSRPDVVQSTLHPWHDGKETHSFCAMLSVHNGNSEIPRSPCTPVWRPAQGSGGLDAEFHKYSVTWAPGKITWFLDDVPYYTVAEEVPDRPMIVVMNLHLSAHWDGPPDASLHLPAILEIHSVRATSIEQH